MSKSSSDRQKISSASPIRYPGGKFRARKLLAEYVPKNTKLVISPFLGGGSFELFLTERNIEVQGYDIFWVLANFWEQLLECPAELGNACQELFGKIDRDTFRAKQAKLIEIETAEHSSMSHDELIAAARDFIVVNRCSFSGATLSGGFSKESATTRFTQTNIDKIKNFSNPFMHAHYGDAFDVIAKAAEEYSSRDDVLLFLDPPYWLEESSANTLYGISGSLHKSFDHQGLYELLDECRLPFVLTYNNDENVRSLYEKYNMSEAEWAYGMNKSKQSKEIVITGNIPE